MSELIRAVIILRLGSFAIGCLTFGLASYFGWPYAGWILIPTVIAGIMCASLSISVEGKS